MKAVILAGGQGTRLRSVTGGMIPKPMAPIAGKPVLEYSVEQLRRCGVTELCITLQCLPEAIESYFSDGERWGVSIRYHVEGSPLGTAGAVRECADFLGEEPFLVLSGDALFHLDLNLLRARHRSLGGVVTMGLCPYAVPLAYGLALTDRQGRIRRFIEKPGWGQVVTDLVNTGIYVLEPSVLEEIPPRVPFDFSRDLFPRLMEQGAALYGVPLSGYWRDVGEPRSYYQANLDVLEGRYPGTATEKETPTAGSTDGATAEERHPGAAPEKERSGAAALFGNTPRLACVVPVPTRKRAALMRALSTALMEAGADFSDGISLLSEGSLVHVAPDGNAERILVESDSAEAAERIVALAKRLESSRNE